MGKDTSISIPDQLVEACSAFGSRLPAVDLLKHEISALCARDLIVAFREGHGPSVGHT